jgi:phage-related protein
VARIAEAFVDIRPNLQGFETTLSKGVGDAVSKTGQTISKTGSTLTKSVTLPIAGAFGVALARTNDVEKSMREVVTLTGEVGSVADATFAEFRSGVAALSAELGVSQSTLTGGLYQALSAGVPRENVFDFMRVATQASIAGVTDAETAVDGLTTIINAFGLQSDDAQRVADSMFTAVKGGKTTFDELSSAMFQVAPIAASAGLEFEEILGAVAALTSQGTPTSVAMTQIRAALSELSKEGTKVSDTFKEATGVGFRDFIAQGGTMQKALEILSDVAGPAVSGAFADLNNDASDLAKTFESRAGVSFKNFIADGGSVADALSMVEDVTGPVSATLADLFGSVEAGGAALALTGTASEKFTSEMEAQANATGAAGAAFGEIDKARSFDRLKVSLDNLSVSAGEILIPAITDLIKIVSPWLEAFGNLDDGTKKIIIGVLSVAAVLGPILIVIGKVVIIVGKLAGAVAFFASPVGLVILAIGALIAIIVIVVKNFDKIKEVLSKVAEAIGAFISGAIQAIKDAFNAVWETVKAVAQGISDAFVAAFDFLVHFFSSTLSAIAEVFTIAFQAIHDFINAIVDGIKSAVTTAFNAIKDFISTVMDTIKEVISAVLDFVLWYWTTILNFILDAVKFVFNAVKDFITTVINTVLTVIRTVLGTIRDVFKTVLDTILTIWKTALNLVLDAVKFVFNAVKDFITTVINTVLNVVTTVLGTIRDVFSTIFNTIRDVVFEAFNRIKDLVVSVVTFLFDSFVNGLRVVKNLFVDTFNGIVDFFSGVVTRLARVGGNIFGFIKDSFKAALNFVINGWNSLRFTIPSFGVGPVKFPGFELGVPRIPLLANGAIVTGPMLAGIGEAGPEAVIPISRPARAMQLMEQSGLANMVRGQGSAVIIQTANFVNGTDADLVAQKVMAAWRGRAAA